MKYILTFLYSVYMWIVVTINALIYLCWNFKKYSKPYQKINESIIKFQRDHYRQITFDQFKIRCSAIITTVLIIVIGCFIAPEITMITFLALLFIGFISVLTYVMITL